MVHITRRMLQQACKHVSSRVAGSGVYAVGGVLVHLVPKKGYNQWFSNNNGSRYLGQFAGIVTAGVGHCHLSMSRRISNTMESDTMSTRISLSDGNTMPIFGLGCYNMDGNAVYNAVVAAVNDGYRLFDTARYYNNESMVGKALIESGLPRDEYFVVTKLFPDNHGYEEAKLNLKQSLQYFGLDYVDLFLIHSPHNGKNMESWKAFVELKQEGLTKSIGVSNYNTQHLEALSATGLEVPAVNQFELHPWNQHKPTVKYCREKNIAVMGYCPLTRGQFLGEGKCPTIDKLSTTYKRTNAQIILRWAVQSGFITIPKSEKKERIKENSGLFGWTLSKDDMSLIENLDEQLAIGAYDAHMFSEWQG